MRGVDGGDRADRRYGSKGMSTSSSLVGHVEQLVIGLNLSSSDLYNDCFLVHPLNDVPLHARPPPVVHQFPHSHFSGSKSPQSALFAAIGSKLFFTVGVNIG